MGHQRLGKLPALRNLPAIVRLLIEGQAEEAELVEAISKACDETLRKALHDPAAIESLWLLIAIPQAASRTDFRDALAAAGVVVPEAVSVEDIAAGFDGAVETVQRRLGANLSDLGEIARLAGISALHGLTQERLPGLWQTTSEDLRTTLATFAGPDKFGELAQRFFTGFVERTIHYFLDRAVPQLLGPAGRFPSIHDLGAFQAGIGRHCREATLIMRTFAREWLAKHSIHGGKTIDRAMAKGFGAYAAEKIRRELAMRSKGNEEN